MTTVLLVVVFLCCFALIGWVIVLRDRLFAAHLALHGIQAKTREIFLSDDFCHRQNSLQILDRSIRNALFDTYGPPIQEIYSLSHLPFGKEET